jgi:hypothetical protein
MSGNSPPWLEGLLKAYALVDQSVSAALAKEKAARERSPVCGPGCCRCCGHIIPVSAVEMAGAMWHLGQKVPAAKRNVILRRFGRISQESCPFLLEGQCLVYALRFMACRQFWVFGVACRAGEDVLTSREDDVLRPDTDLKMLAFAKLRTIYGMQDDGVVDKKSLYGFIKRVSLPIQMWRMHPVKSLHELASTKRFSLE